MARKLKIAALVVVALIVAAAGYVGLQIARFMRVQAVQLDPKLIAFMGGGGNSLALLTDKGVVLVDTKVWIGASRLFEAVQKLNAGPVRAIVNTHHHGDHTHGNPRAPAGVAVHAAAGCKDLMLRFDGDFWKDEPARSTLPNQPFEGEARVDFGEDVLRLIHLPGSHTGADTAVYFEKRKVLHGGDVFINGFYANIDLPAGGSAKGYLAALDRMLALPFETAIPGHGPVSKRADVEKARAYHAALWEYAQQAVKLALTPAQAAEKAPASLRGLDAFPGLTSLQKNIAWAMEEAARSGAATR